MAVLGRIVVKLVTCFVFIVGTAYLHAEGLEFRVDTEVFKNDDKKPILEQLTIFAADGTVYDFQLTAPRETTVFDSRHGRFTLLDETKKVKSVVATQEIMDVSFALEAFAAKQGNGLLRFCAAPQFETEAEGFELGSQ